MSGKALDTVLGALLLLTLSGACLLCSRGGGSNTAHSCAEACAPNPMQSWDWTDGCVCAVPIP